MSKNHCKSCFSKTTKEIILRFFFRPFFRKGGFILTVLLLGSTLLFSGCQPASVPKLLDHVLDHVLDPLWNRFSPVSQEDGDEYSDGISPLHVEGTHLMNDHGEIVQLKGLSTHGIAWFPQYINSDFFLELKTQWHADVIRLAMYTQEYGGYCSGGDPTQLKMLLKNGIAYAEEAGLYVIVDWHILSDGDPSLHKAEALEFFREFSSEYSGNPHILYEICNEPNGGTSWPQIKSYAEEVISVIRENDPNAVVLVGTPTWSQDVDLAALDPITEYNNVMYSLHFYADTHRESLRDKLITAVSQGLPVFVTEYGICDASGSGAINEEQADAWMALLDQYQISSCAWNISNKSETSAIFRADCEKVSGFASEDLSVSGQWVFSMLQRSRGSLPASSSFENENTGKNESLLPDHSHQDFSEESAIESPPGTSQNSQPATSFREENVFLLSDSNLLQNGLTIRPELKNTWDSNGHTYFQYTLNLTNTSDKSLGDWVIELPLRVPVTLDNSWCCRIQLEDDTLTLRNESFNGTLNPGQEIKDIGFIIYN